MLVTPRARTPVCCPIHKGVPTRRAFRIDPGGHTYPARPKAPPLRTGAVVGRGLNGNGTAAAVRPDIDLGVQVDKVAAGVIGLALVVGGIAILALGETNINLVGVR